VSALTSGNRIKALEINALAEVIARDRKRVEAETASFSRAIAEATVHRPGQQS
jgi:hypothetical protein